MSCSAQLRMKNLWPLALLQQIAYLIFDHSPIWDESCDDLCPTYDVRWVKMRIFKRWAFLFCVSESGIRNICELYVLSKLRSLKGNNKKKKNIFFRVAGWCGGSHRFQHLKAPGSNPSSVIFSRRGGYILCFHILLKTWIEDSFAYLFCFLFYSMKFVYADGTSPDGQKEPALIWRPYRHRQTLFTSHL